MTTHRFKKSQLSPKSAIAKLIHMRTAIGADTPTGRTISTLAEQAENMKTWTLQPWMVDERQTLPFMLKKSLARLGG